MVLLSKIKTKSKDIGLLYAIVFIPMWSIFLINNVFLMDSLNSLGGIHPRDFSVLGLLEIFTSWMFHSSGNRGMPGNNMFSHIFGNSEILVALLFIVGIFEKRPILLVFSLIGASGLATWLFGAPDSVHVGASGLVFAMFGYIVASIFFAKKWLYLIPIFFAGSGYLYSIQMGLIPKSGTSFAAHFGGLIGGILVAYMIGKYQKNQINLPQRDLFYTTSKTEFTLQKFRNFFTRR